MQTPTHMDSHCLETSSSCGDLSVREYSTQNSPMKPLFAEHMTKRRAGNNNQSIDMQKYRTKMCRNHLMGLRCPFEDRCVFAHGEEQMRESSGVSSPAPELAPIALTAAAATTNVLASPAVSTKSAGLPSYENFMHSAVSNSNIFSETASPAESRPQTPPSPTQAYPARFRYDPYVSGGIVFQQ